MGAVKSWVNILVRCGEVLLTGTYLLLNKYKTFITVVNLFLVRETQGRFIKDVMEQLSLDIRSIVGRYIAQKINILDTEIYINILWNNSRIQDTEMNWRKRNLVKRTFFILKKSFENRISWQNSLFLFLLLRQDEWPPIWDI